MPLKPQGRVLLVGVGPGAADLLTVRAVRALAGADVVLADALVADEVCALIPSTARLLKTGKRGHRTSTPQDFINRLMLRLALAGETVVRLKGGDPSIFGRVAEERAFLERHGVEVEVIPGVTAASAAAAEFGFALTTRGGARAVLLATGRTIEGAWEDWAIAANPSATLCLYMGCGDIAVITAKLLAAGRAGETPAIAAIDISRPQSRLISSTLAGLAVALADKSESAPVLIAIGEVCADAVSIARAQTGFPHAPDLQAC